MEVQIYTSCNVRLLETDQEVANTVVQFTKAVAGTPLKYIFLVVIFPSIISILHSIQK